MIYSGFFPVFMMMFLALTFFMLNTLADNARKFTSRDGRVTVTASELADSVERASEFPHFKVKGDSGRLLGASRWQMSTRWLHLRIRNRIIEAFKINSSGS